MSPAGDFGIDNESRHIQQYLSAVTETGRRRCDANEQKQSHATMGPSTLTSYVCFLSLLDRLMI